MKLKNQDYNYKLEKDQGIEEIECLLIQQFKKNNKK